MKNETSERLKAMLDDKGQGLLILQKNLGYIFKNILLLLRSVTHRSYVFERADLLKEDNETLEFLGDAVLDLVISNLLIENYPDMDEGQLTKLRSVLVQENHLAFMARELGLGDFLILGKGEECSGGRAKDSILACAFEAVVGAVFTDGGYEAVRPVLENKFLNRLEVCRKKTALADAKSTLQEITQERYGEAPTYKLDKAEGPDHDKTFTVSILFQGNILANAVAKSKKAAEQKAAAIAIEKISK